MSNSHPPTELILPIPAEAKRVGDELGYTAHDLANSIGNLSLILVANKTCGGGLYRPTDNPHVLVRRTGTASQLESGIPSGLDKLTEHMEWYEAELKELTAAPGFSALPHYAVLANLPGHKNTSLWTVTPYMPNLKPLGASRIPGIGSRHSRRIFDNAERYLGAGKPTRRVIKDALYPEQWHRRRGEYTIHDLDPFADFASSELSALRYARKASGSNTILQRRIQRR